MDAINYNKFYAPDASSILFALKAKTFRMITSKIGDGLSTRFWLDIWVSEIPLSERFPRLFMLDVEKEVSVAAKLGSVSIDVSFRRGVRDGVERQQWDDLQSLMQSVFLSSLGDRWICDLSGDGEFRVKEDSVEGVSAMSSSVQSIAQCHL
ncbi:hypothetical protein Tco_1216215 [Tanacetum coccineum]